MSGYILALDQGTTSSRAIVFDESLRVLGTGQGEFTQHFPQAGWVEHDPEDLFGTIVQSARTALNASGLSARDIAAIGIANQRETVMIWERANGRAIANAIVWQDRRTAETCRRLKAEGHETLVTERTGLVLDPYFSATKIGWMLDSVPGARERAGRGELLFGTVDSFLLFRLTGGRVHATDATNAARTLLYDIGRGAWDDDLLELFGVPRAMLPEVRDNAADFGETDPALFGAAIPIRGMAGDQQAATLGQACFEPGMVKSTYGTGCFVVMNTGGERVRSQHRMLTTIAYRLDGTTTYALEGSIFVAGAVVQWLRDGLGVIERAERSGPVAAVNEREDDLVLVPAFTGLGAPWWEPEARGALLGITRGTTAGDVVRAGLDSVAFQTADLLQAMRADWPEGEGAQPLRVDGGMVASDWTMQRLADTLRVTVDRPVVTETTALGAAWLAGHRAGVWPDQRGFAGRWQRERQFEPQADEALIERRLRGWRRAVRAVVAHAGDRD